MPNPKTQSTFPIAALIETRCAEIKLSRSDLIRKIGYANFNKGHRKLSQLMAGERNRFVYENLADALDLPETKIREASEQTVAAPGGSIRCVSGGGGALVCDPLASGHGLCANQWKCGQ